MKIMNHMVDNVTKYYKTTLFFTLIITLVMAFYFIQQEQDNNIKVFFEENDIIYNRYSDFIDEYGSEEFVIIAFKEDDLFTNSIISLTRDLSAELKKIKGVERVVGLTDWEEPLGKDDTINFEKIIPEGELSPEELKQVKRKVLSNSMIKGYLISENGKTLSVLVELESLEDMEQNEKFTTLKEIVGAAKTVLNGKMKFYYTGIPFVENEANRLSQRDVRIFSVVTAVLIATIVLMLFRNLILTAAAMLTLLLTQIWGIGFFVMYGETMNWVTTAIFPILLAMAIADSIHLITHFKEIYVPGESNVAAKVAEATKAIFIPCLLTTLTTCIGFVSFATSPLRPSCIMGIFTAIGVFFAFVIDVTFLPALLALMRDRIAEAFSGNKSHPSGEHFGVAHKFLVVVGRFSTTYIKTLLIIFALIIFVSLIGMTKLKFETNPSNYLHDSSEVKKNSTFLDENFGGAIPFMVQIKSNGGIDFTDPDALSKVDVVQQIISEHELITNSTSIIDYIKEVNKAFNNNDDAYYKIPENPWDIVDFYELSEPEIIERLLSDDKKEVCIAFLSKWGTNERAVESHHYFKKTIGEMLGDDFSFSFTGMTTLYIAMEEMLKISQRRSLGVAFVLIFIMMLFVCKNLKLAIVSMIPNTFPIILTLGIMGWFNIRLNAATIMIASVTLGVAVDDTIHFIAWYRRLSEPEMHPRDVIRKTFLAVGKPLMITTVLLFLGFSVFVLGSFIPIQTFGVLTAFSLLFALIGDFLLLPALILILKPVIKADVHLSKTVNSPSLLNNEGA